MAGHSPSKTGANALLSRPSRLGKHCASLIGIAGTSPAMTTKVVRALRKVAYLHGFSFFISSEVISPEMAKSV